MSKTVICLSPGYVESHRVWKTFFVARQAFDDDDAALDSLARDLWNIYDDDKATQYWRKCCRASMEKGHKFCPDCGTRVQEEELTPEQLGDFVVELLSADANALGDVLETWWPWDSMEDILKNVDRWVFLEDDWAETKMAERMLSVREKTK